MIVAIDNRHSVSWWSYIARVVISVVSTTFSARIVTAIRAIMAVMSRLR